MGSYLANEVIVFIGRLRMLSVANLRREEGHR